MNQQHITKIKDTVNDIGLIGTLNIFGGDKSIIRQAYIDNPESYLDYLIDNLIPKDNIGYIKKLWSYNFKKNIFIVYDDNQDIVTVDDYIWNFFYRGVMQFDDAKIESIFTEWFYKHIPELSEKKPKSYSDLDNIMRRWKHTESRNVPDYMIVSRSVADYLKTIDVGKINNIGG